MSDKIERDLTQAQQAIDMLEMIKEKTKGNISNELNKVMEGFLTELRLNYVDESNKK